MINSKLTTFILNYTLWNYKFTGSSEAPANAGIPLTRSNNVAAIGLFYIKVQMCCIAQVDVGAYANLPPAAEVLLEATGYTIFTKGYVRFTSKSYK